MLYWQLCDADYKLKGNILTLQTGHGPACVVILDSADQGKCECFKGDDRPIGWQSLYYGNRKLAPTLIYSKRADLPARLITLVSLGEITEEICSKQDNAISWTLSESGSKYEVCLKSIVDGESNIFAFGQKDLKKLFLG